MLCVLLAGYYKPRPSVIQRILGLCIDIPFASCTKHVQNSTSITPCGVLALDVGGRTHRHSGVCPSPSEASTVSSIG